jgi:hypothetical protein
MGVNVSLTTEEHELLVRMLEVSLGDTRVEVHRTHYSPKLRDDLINEENLIRALLDKLRKIPS